jgi:hypothetical protein
MAYKKIAGNERKRIPEHKKKNALAMPAMRNGITVFIDLDATVHNPPMTTRTFARVTKLIKKEVLK